MRSPFQSNFIVFIAEAEVAARRLREAEAALPQVGEAMVARHLYPGVVEANPVFHGHAVGEVRELRSDMIVPMLVALAVGAALHHPEMEGSKDDSAAAQG